MFPHNPQKDWLWLCTVLSNRLVLLQDNSGPHVAKKTLEFLEKFRWEVLQHPPYSLDISPCDSHIFGPLKKISDSRPNILFCTYVDGEKTPLSSENRALLVSDVIGKSNLIGSVIHDRGLRRELLNRTKKI
ncbi:hypothetical protein AVEN_258180-1 [Araneus ventricosus]|uniref:Histone-lysine N-methyltransferase SETMAR n=1 Tax=Araneus ventricosus TaxID=182803 RepID=A0A4Y2VL85_ARAVE|nr:hypothetical protein AVEN_258180-1 [Araneus ventricosus]